MLCTAPSRVVPTHHGTQRQLSGAKASTARSVRGFWGPQGGHSPGPAAGITRWCSRLPFPELLEQEPRPGMLRGLPAVAGALGVVLPLMPSTGKMFPISPRVPGLAGRCRMCPWRAQGILLLLARISPSPQPAAVSQSSPCSTSWDTLRALSQGIASSPLNTNGTKKSRAMARNFIQTHQPRGRAGVGVVVRSRCRERGLDGLVRAPRVQPMAWVASAGTASWLSSCK